MSSKPIKATEAPSDLELMLYADGELEGERHAAVEAYLAREKTAATKLAALDFVSNVVRERALGASASADGIADAVMARIAAEAAPAAGARPRPPSTPVPHPLAAGARRTKPANDNARGIFALAGVAVAAAAALMIWGRMATGPEVPIAARTVTPEIATVPPAPLAKSAEPAAESEAERDVEIAAVDFGGRIGSIFNVPTGAAASNSTTVVVWLNDDGAGGE